jgi:putative transposase
LTWGKAYGPHTHGSKSSQATCSLETPSFITGKIGCIIRGWEEQFAMKASKFSDAQKAFIIRQGEDGTSVEGVCRKAGIGQATCFNWKKRYRGLMPSEMKRLKELEDENSRLKRWRRGCIQTRPLSSPTNVEEVAPKGSEGERRALSSRPARSA